MAILPYKAAEITENVGAIGVNMQRTIMKKVINSLKNQESIIPSIKDFPTDLFLPKYPRLRFVI